MFQNFFKIFVGFVLGGLIVINTALAVNYAPLAPLQGYIEPGQEGVKYLATEGGAEQGLTGYLKTMYRLGVGIATALAVIMIMWGGIEYMSTDAIGGKEEGKERINNALAGLLLALGSYIILRTINKELVETDLNITELNIVADKAPIPIITPYTFEGNDIGGRSAAVDPAYLDSISNNPDGNITLTAYGYSGDLTPDVNSSQGRGNRDNLLTSGSVALSPDLIRRLQPQHGAAIYVGNKKVGYYDDSTAESYKGKPLTNRVDIYDPSGSLGGNSFSKKIKGEIRADNNDIRRQVPNPSPDS